MKLISWNVNGLRAVVKKDFVDIFAQLDADIFACQETKLQDGQIDLEFDGYTSYWNYAHKKGYSGTVVYTKREPLQVLRNLGKEDLDTEGRLLALEFADFWFVNVYTPNAQNGLARIDHRMDWDDHFRHFCTNLAAEKPVVMCGDFNVAHNEIDLKNPGPNKGNAGFSDQERDRFTRLLDAGFVDSYRSLHPDTVEYSWWSYRFNARANNAGWRIDYFLVSQAVADKIDDACIYNDVFGSDHCPVGLQITL